MIFSGLYSTNPLKNLAYVYSKFQKGRGKKWCDAMWYDL